MRIGSSHLRLVGAAAPEVLPTMEATGDVRGIAVIVRNVLPGQVCEILHNGIFSLAHAVVIADDATSVVLESFSLRPGNYEVSLRIDGELQLDTAPTTVIVGTQAMSVPASTA